jgi:hypothetical protein
MPVWHQNFCSLTGGVDADKPFTKKDSTFFAFNGSQTDAAHSVAKISDEPAALTLDFLRLIISVTTDAGAIRHIWGHLDEQQSIAIQYPDDGMSGLMATFVSFLFV